MFISYVSALLRAIRREDHSFSLSHCANSLVISALRDCLVAALVDASRCFTNSSILAARISARVSGFFGLLTLYLSSIDLYYPLSLYLARMHLGVVLIKTNPLRADNCHI